MGQDFNEEIGKVIYEARNKVARINIENTNPKLPQVRVFVAIESPVPITKKQSELLRAFHLSLQSKLNEL